MTKILTDKQERILKFIGDYIDGRGYPPSIREIGNSFGISSLRGTTVHLDALERKGYIKRGSCARSIVVIGRMSASKRAEGMDSIPIVDQSTIVPRGRPVITEFNTKGRQAFPHCLGGPGAFMIRVERNDLSMLAGDLVIVGLQSMPKHGEMAAVMSPALGFLFTRDPENIVDGNYVVGRVVGLLRTY